MYIDKLHQTFYFDFTMMHCTVSISTLHIFPKYFHVRVHPSAPIRNIWMTLYFIKCMCIYICIHSNKVYSVYFVHNACKLSIQLY